MSVVLTKNLEKRIRNLAVRKHRQKTGQFVAEGWKLVRDLYTAGMRAELIFHVGELPEPLDGPQTVEISSAEMKRITHLESASPVLAVFDQPRIELADFSEASMVLLLDRVQDPGNVGTLLRTALWYGVETVGTAVGTADHWSPKVVQASMSAVAHVKVWHQTEEAWIQWARDHGFAIVVADMHGVAARELNWPEKTLLVLGNEGQGASETFRKAAQTVVTLPGNSGKMESLNVAVSGATLLYEFAVSSK